MSARSLTMACVAVAVIPLLMGAGGISPSKAPASTQNPSTTPAQTSTPGRVIIAGREVMQLVPVGYYSGEERAAEVMRRVSRVLEPGQYALNETIHPFDVNTDITIEAKDTGEPVIHFQGATIATVTAPDAQAVGQTADQVAQMWANNLKAGLSALPPGNQASLRQIMEQIQVASGDQIITNAYTGASDTMIAQRIRRRIAQDPILRNSNVGVDVRSNEVVIYGDVRVPRAEQRLERVVREVVNDRPVRSDLRIQGSPGRQ